MVTPRPQPRPTARSVSRWALPVSLSLLVLLVAPVLGRLRDLLLDTFGARALTVLGVGLAVGAVGALAVAVVRIRERRWRRWGALAAAALLVAAQLALWQSGDRRVDVVERFHLVEYGLLAALWWRAFRDWDPVRERAAMALPVLAFAAAALVGVLDEWVQFLTPLRVGDGRDVLLNWLAVGIGLLAGYALAPPAPGVLAWRRRSWARPARRVAGTSLALLVLATGSFVVVAHLGHEVDDPRTGSFVSWYPADELVEEGRERARRWAEEAPTGLDPWALEDLWLTEAAAHVRERNDAWSQGAIERAFAENRILEVWYDPFLDLASFRTGVVHRWPAEQRLDAARRAEGLDLATYRSPVHRTRVFPSPPEPVVWAATVLLALGCLAWALAPWRRPERSV